MIVKNDFSFFSEKVDEEINVMIFEITNDFQTFMCCIFEEHFFHDFSK